MIRRNPMVWGALFAAGFCLVSLVMREQPQAGAQPTPTGKPAAAIATHDISLDQAHVALEAAMKKAIETKTKMDIAVVDAGGNLKAFARMDGAWLGSIDIAIKKAKTARYFNMDTGEIGKLSQPGQPLYMIEVSNGGLITFPGGVPIKTQDGHVIASQDNAIGVLGPHRTGPSNPPSQGRGSPPAHRFVPGAERPALR